MHAVIFYVFFFFQAEDGIRDLTVTGVQTCALPISRPSTPAAAIHIGQFGQTWPSTLQSTWHSVCASRSTGRASGGPDCSRAGLQTGITLASKRSEERRVGKEGRSRWSPYH